MEFCNRYSSACTYNTQYLINRVDPLIIQFAVSKDFFIG